MPVLPIEHKTNWRMYSNFHKCNSKDKQEHISKKYLEILDIPSKQSSTYFKHLFMEHTQN